MRYGIIHLKNHSIHHHDTLFVYKNMEKAEFKPAKFTTTVTYITQDDKLYNRITANALCAKTLAINAFRGSQTIP
jgi:hypothetical protein